MERELKNIKFFELPDSFEDDVIEKIRKIKRRKRTKILALPLVLIVALTFLSLVLFNFDSEEKGRKENDLSMTGTHEKQLSSDVYLEVIPVQSFEKENRYLIEFVTEKEEKIYSF